MVFVQGSNDDSYFDLESFRKNRRSASRQLKQKGIRIGEVNGSYAKNLLGRLNYRN